MIRAVLSIAHAALAYCCFDRALTQDHAPAAYHFEAVALGALCLATIAALLARPDRVGNAHRDRLLSTIGLFGVRRTA